MKGFPVDRLPNILVRIAVVLLTLLIVEGATAGTLPPPLNDSWVDDNWVGLPGGYDGQNALNGIASVSDTAGTYAGNAMATATYGSLGVESFTSFAISGSPESAYSDAIAYDRDNMTVSSPAFNGSEGLLYLYYTLDGTIATSGAGTSVVQVAIDVTNSVTSVEQMTNTAYTSSTSGTFLAPTAFTFTFGQPFELQICLGAATGTQITPAVLSSSGHLTTAECSPGGGSGLTGSGTGTASFFNTLTLSGITVTDSAGDPVSGVQFTSASGTQYGPDGVVPEPGSLLLLGSGLTVAVVLRRRIPTRWR
jgi:hypothetical protein